MDSTIGSPNIVDILVAADQPMDVTKYNFNCINEDMDNFPFYEDQETAF